MEYGEPQEVREPGELAEIFRFRAEVWRATGQLAEDAFGPDGWCDPLDRNARHWTVRGPDGRLAAAGRLTLHARLDQVHESHEYQRYGLDLPGPVAGPDRVVVATWAQGQGLGRKVLDAQDAAAREMGARFGVRQASPDMVRLLEQRGWRIVGPASRDPRFPGVLFTVTYCQYAA